MPISTDHDVVVENHGSLYTFILCTQPARDWVEENVEIEGYMWTNRITFACEFRYARDLCLGMQHAGLKVV